MCKRVLIGSLMVVALIAAGLAYAAVVADVSAIADPGRLETFVAVRAKRLLIARAADREAGPAPGSDPRRVKIGGMVFRASCAQCHGNDGRSPTDVGQGLYPRAPDLGAPAVQQWSDQELFWIVKNGIRLTGMPAFGKVLPDERIWDLVAYLRQVGRQPPALEARVITGSVEP